MPPDSSQRHSYGQTCAYYDPGPEDPLPAGSDTPPVKSQFFYVSSLPIDDPLSPLPPISADRSTKQPPQPFSARDNAALEEAWLGSQSTQGPGTQKMARPRPKGMFSFPKFKQGVKSPAVLSPSGTHALDTPRSIRAGESSRERVAVNKVASNTQAESDVMLSQSPPDGQTSPVDTKELRRQESRTDASPTRSHKHHRQLSPFRRRSKGQKDLATTSKNSTMNSIDQPAAQPTASDISGRPFARAPSKRNISGIATDGAHDSPVWDHSENERSPSRSQSKERSGKAKRRASSGAGKVFIPVGVARLHLVELPDLVMKPIYWSPINDTSNVIRATWFYKDTMLPVPADVANRLESGYEHIKPYFDTYQDELQACIEHGASAEMKVVWKLWPDETKSSRPNTGDLKLDDASEDQEVPLPDHAENVALDSSQESRKRTFKTYSVIYTDRRNAQILKPNLLPSVPQKRRPLNSVRKGRQIGIAVVRGFDRNVWARLHPGPKMTTRKAHASVGAYMSQSGDATTRGRRPSCAACDDDSQTPKVSDLVLVIHGIGQKLSERVDSYHFTHAINSFRREFNVELTSENMKGNLKTTAGIMVLPVNWRLTVDFEEDARSGDKTDPAKKYELANITPETLPAVRSIISDVMLDIPYYMSHHKDKMISAVIREANRVYRLWCRNNPGFQEHGRVHLIGHSLGSVMAIEILSKQPTRVPSSLAIGKGEPSENMFEFDTTNLFCCGSPAGFFLLLNGARLVPRKGRNKPGMEGEDHGRAIASEASFGCLAVNNLYNICHRNDPIAYLLNAAVDTDYATSLQPASVPSASISLFASLWSKSNVDAYAVKGLATRPIMQQMPSTVEMETHNFTLEEIAEKRMYLLNENGQIDYYLSSSGGPLEIQYLSMLSAHSSYWLSRDFVRFLVVEIGRKAGKANTVEVLRAVKKREWKRGDLK